ncbi:peptidoglycan-binding protein [Terriglobus sp.]|uniref:peptidoglycan-binding protein n=1 Tax=Terriglobus sp. TaxID=1889013 RepID=UPI003AFF7FF1
MYRSSFLQRGIVSVIAAGLVVLPAAASHLRRGPTSPRSHHGLQNKGTSKSVSHSASSSRPRAIDDARATEIQGALVKAGYLQSASGHWDDASADAMRKLQADNGWQTKLIPDSRALIKLGLGANGGGPATGSTNLIAPAE